jgi:hypothetical protein
LIGLRPLLGVDKEHGSNSALVAGIEILFVQCDAAAVGTDEVN